MNRLIAAEVLAGLHHTPNTCEKGSIDEFNQELSCKTISLNTTVNVM